MSDAAAGVFISYRRQEANWLAAWLHDRLVAQFGETRVFLDIDWIKPGVDFMQVITEAIARHPVSVIDLLAHPDVGQTRQPSRAARSAATTPGSSGSHPASASNPESINAANRVDAGSRAAAGRAHATRPARRPRPHRPAPARSDPGDPGDPRSTPRSPAGSGSSSRGLGTPHPGLGPRRLIHFDRTRPSRAQRRRPALPRHRRADRGHPRYPRAGQLGALPGQQLEQHLRPDPSLRTPLSASGRVVLPRPAAAQVEQPALGRLGA